MHLWTASMALGLLACVKPPTTLEPTIRIPDTAALAFSSQDGRVWVYGEGRLLSPLRFEGQAACAGPQELQGWVRVEGCEVPAGVWGVAGVEVGRVEAVPFVDTSYGAGESSERAALVWDLPTCGDEGLRLARQRQPGKAWVGSLVCGEQAWWLKPDQGVEAAFLVDEDLWVVLSQPGSLSVVALGLGGMREVLVAPRPGAG